MYAIFVRAKMATFNLSKFHSRPSDAKTREINVDELFQSSREAYTLRTEYVSITNRILN